MAKRKAAFGAASETIREALESGTTATKDIKAALSAKGVTASDALIHNVRGRWKKANGMPMARRGKPGRKKVVVLASALDSPKPSRVSSAKVDSLGAAIVFCRAAGGIEKARAILAQLDEFKNM